MKHLKTTLLASTVAITAAGASWAGEFDGVELKMLAIGDTSVTRLAPDRQ